MKLRFGILLAILFIGAAWWCNHRARQLTGIPVQSAASIADTTPGTEIAVYGGIWTGAGEGLRIFISELRECRTRTTTKDGKMETKTDCDWIEAGRTTPAFDVVVDGQQVRVTNVDYLVTGPNRFVSTGYASRMRGFANGDGVLILGTAGPGGITAREVYGGTRAQYLSGMRAVVWLLGIAAVLSAIIGVIAAWAER